MSKSATIETVTIARGDHRAELLTLGATLRRLQVPGRDGRRANVVLGYRDLEEYRARARFYGATAGRYANRIGGARFTLDGVEYRLPANNGANNLHSGPGGFDLQDWTIEARDAHSVTFALLSPHLHNGFPGNLHVRVRYAIEPDGLSIGFRATADRVTVVNLTNHAYFNLAGESSGTTILDHLLQIPASQITPVGAGLIPTGEYKSVEGTPFDFRIPKPVGRDIEAADPQLALGHGYDHNFVLVGAAGTIRRIATLFDPASGRVMDVHSTEPGVQLYTANHIANGAPGTGGGIYPARGGLCLEPQKFPDTPNKPNFPSARLDPGEEYRHDMAFRFRTAEDLAGAFE
ncbi:aldose epimerase family protein [Sphingomonas psychrotolerans]|uniref:Aldose 1-epimerase n=1 Tax=Sphingomonas psychrotolerans TaxID=1327635 RepID=A0A2K8ML42_9SPHN|nr:aldose epimerase family protein [Sphingomonas psychrotolerans]ATY33286.1 galactose-1-epimerase [Sphingomonas psychrotolerans]